jgi:small subunit ribosomal protein S4
MRKVSDYAIQLREKQKVKRMYGMLENQFRRFFHEADRQKGVTGENLLNLLERRLDNAIFRLGFACSRTQARQIVRHNHILVNGRKVNVPSFSVRVNDVISLKEKSRSNEMLKENLEAATHRGVPSWLELDQEKFSGKVKAIPDRTEVTMPIQEQLIVELYSK